MLGFWGSIKNIAIWAVWALTLSSCGFSIRRVAREATVSGTITLPVSQLEWSDLTHDFGVVDLGGISSPMTFTLTHAAGSAATGCSVAALSNSVDFTISSDSCGANDLPESGTCTIVVRGTPSSAGVRTTTLTRSCSVGGTATTIPDQISVTGGTPNLIWSPLAHSFGPVNVGTTSTSTSFTLNNSGNGSATGCSAPVLSNTTDFSIQSESCGSSNLGSGNSCLVEIRANPASDGARFATLSRTCSLGGTASTTALQITTTGTSPGLAFSPLIHSFGTVNVGSNSSSQTFTLGNSGTGPATGCSAPALSNPTDFTIIAETCLTTDLAPAATCDVVVRANPSASGSLSTTLSRTCSIGGAVSTTAHQILVTGNPVTATWDPLAVNFGMILTGYSSSALTFTLTNHSVSTLSGCSAPSITNTTDFTLVSDTCGTANLAVGASCAVQIQANPATNGTKSATLARTCSTGGTLSTTPNQITVTGTYPSLSWSPSDHDFGDVNVGSDSASRTFTLTNSGTASALGCSEPVLDNTTDFTLLTDVCGTGNLAATSSCSVTVRAHPQATGPATATLSRTCTVGGTASTTSDQITVNGTEPQLSISASTVSFGSVAIGNTSSPEILTLSNTGTGPATGCSAASLSNATDFTILSDTCGTSDIPASGSCTLTLAATPTAPGGSVSATLTRNCSRGGPLSATLDVTGAPPTLIQFGDGGQWSHQPRTGFTLRASPCTGAPLAGCASPGTVGVPVGSPITLTRTISGILDGTGTHTVTVNTKPVTATSAQFTPGTFTVTFNPGETTKTIDSSQLSVIANAAITADTYFIMDLSNPTHNAQLGSASRAQVNLIDPNYVAPAHAGGGSVIFSEPFFTAIDGNPSVRLTLHRAFNTTATEEFELQLFDGDGVCGTDYSVPGIGSCTPDARTGAYVSPTPVVFNSGTPNQELQLSIPLMVNNTARTQGRNTSFYAQLVPRAGSNPGRPRTQSIAKVRILNTDTSGNTCNPSAPTPFGGGLGTAGNPYLICSFSQWTAMNNPASCGTATPGGVANGGSSCQSGSVHYKLMRDLPPTGGLTQFTGYNSHLDGNQYAVMGFHNFPSVGESLFTGIGPSGASTLIRSLNLLHAYQAMSSSCRGLLIGNNSGTSAFGARLSDVFVSGYLTATGSSSGHGLITGCMNANGNASNLSMERVMAHGLIRVTSSSTSNVGGLVGGQVWNPSPSLSTNMAISSSFSSVNIIGPAQNVGGVIGSVGQNSSINIAGTQLSRLQATGYLNGESYVGGITGRVATRRTSTTPATFALIQNTFTGSVYLESSGTDYGAGILAGITCTSCAHSTFNLSDNLSSGTLTSGFGGRLGGILGGFDSSGSTIHSTVTISNNTAYGNILGSTQSTGSGGLVGNLNHNTSTSVAGTGSFNSNSVNISGNTASGQVYATPADKIGGLIGSAFARLAEISISQNTATGTVHCNSQCGGMYGFLGTHANNVGKIESTANLSSGAVRPAGSDAGGLVGLSEFQTSFTRDKSNSPLTTIGSLSENLGGFVGTSNEGVTYTLCQANGEISQTAPGNLGNRAGGFAGRLTGSGGAGAVINRSWTTGNISLGNVSGAILGGFVGAVDTGSHSISQSYVASATLNSGGTSGNNSVGGFAGQIQTGASLSLNGVYTATTASASSGTVQGFAGSVQGTLTFADVYYLGATPQAPVNGINIPNPSISDAQDKTDGMYAPAIWDNNFVTGNAWVAPNSLGINPCSTPGCPNAFYTLPVLIYP
jgi:hypothetical protein